MLSTAWGYRLDGNHPVADVNAEAMASAEHSPRPPPEAIRLAGIRQPTARSDCNPENIVHRAAPQVGET